MRKFLVLLSVLCMACVSLAESPAIYSVRPYDGQILLGTANTVVLRGEINDESATSAALQILNLANQRGDKNYPIFLVLDTPGGSIDAGESFIEIAKSVRNLHTITLFAASMGSAIVEALPGNRYILDSGILMFHRAKGGVSGQFETGELETRLDFYKRFVRRMEQRNADRMNMSLADYKTAVKDELWMTSGDAIERGGADRVVTVTCTNALIEKQESVTVEAFIFRITLNFSGCPLLRAGTIAPGQSDTTIEAYNKYLSTQPNFLRGY